MYILVGKPITWLLFFLLGYAVRTIIQHRDDWFK